MWLHLIKARKVTNKLHWLDSYQHEPQEDVNPISEEISDKNRYISYPKNIHFKNYMADNKCQHQLSKLSRAVGFGLRKSKGSSFGDAVHTIKGITLGDDGKRWPHHDAIDLKSYSGVRLGREEESMRNDPRYKYRLNPTAIELARTEDSKRFNHNLPEEISCEIIEMLKQYKNNFMNIKFESSPKQDSVTYRDIPIEAVEDQYDWEGNLRENPKKQRWQESLAREGEEPDAGKEYRIQYNLNYTKEEKEGDMADLFKYVNVLKVYRTNQLVFQMGYKIKVRLDNTSPVEGWSKRKTKMNERELLKKLDWKNWTETEGLI
jgi:hypothetical protein